MSLQISDRVVVALDVLHPDVALLVDLVVPVKLDVLQHAVALDDEGGPAHDLQILHLGVQFLSEGRGTVRQVAKAGENETIGKSGSSAPPANSGLHSSICPPATLKRCLLFM